MTKPKTLEQLRIRHNKGPVDKVARRSFLWYNKFNKHEFAMRGINYIVKNLYTFF